MDGELHLVSLLGRVVDKDASQLSSGQALSGEILHSSLRHSLLSPPSTTTLRINTLKYRTEDAHADLKSYLSKQEKLEAIPHSLLTHPNVPDVVAIPTKGPRCDLLQVDKKIIVGIQCGNSVLRGANVYAPGVLGAPKALSKGDYVSVYSDIEGKCLQGTAGTYHGSTMFVGNGIALMNREQLFGHNHLEKGTAVKMVDALYLSPSFNGHELRDVFFLQNLPSIVVSHVLGPKPGERILDMCAAPGGKTIHIATLMQDKGCVIALDKSAPKVVKLKENVQRFNLSCIRCFKFDATKSLCPSSPDQDVPPFSPESFDRILVDAPCSALGQRPQPKWVLGLRDLKSYPCYQKKIIKQAIGLLKVGGTLVYSTCTYSPDENECQVKWILEEFDNMTLEHQDPVLGYPGLPCFGLEERTLGKLQRFWPKDFADTLCEHKVYDKTSDASTLTDTIAFFIAKFVKVK